MNVRPFPFSHSRVTGLLGLKTLLPLTLHLDWLSGTISLPEVAQPVSKKYACSYFFGLSKITFFVSELLW